MGDVIVQARAPARNRLSDCSVPTASDDDAVDDVAEDEARRRPLDSGPIGCDGPLMRAVQMKRGASAGVGAAALLAGVRFPPRVRRGRAQAAHPARPSSRAVLTVERELLRRRTRWPRGGTCGRLGLDAALLDMISERVLEPGEAGSRADRWRLGTGSWWAERHPRLESGGTVV